MNEFFIFQWNCFFFSGSVYLSTSVKPDAKLATLAGNFTGNQTFDFDLENLDIVSDSPDLGDFKQPKLGSSAIRQNST